MSWYQNRWRGLMLGQLAVHLKNLSIEYMRSGAIYQTYNALIDISTKDATQVKKAMYGQTTPRIVVREAKIWLFVAAKTQKDMSVNARSTVGDIRPID
jgi:hypothetical protein